MANVTDFPFRSLIAKYGKPDVMWNEFVSADGLISAGKERLLMDLKFSKKEKPIVAQLFTGHPEAMRKAAALCAELGFDGLDINMGCPDKAVEKQGGGAASIKDPKNALAVLAAARKGWVEGKEKTEKKLSYTASYAEASEGRGEGICPVPKITNATMSHLHKVGETDVPATLPISPDLGIIPLIIPVPIPVTIKTRFGYSKVDFDWIRLLFEQNLPALTIHLRTRKEMSDVPAHWELMPEIVKLRDEVQANIEPSERTLIIGNGDVESIADGFEKTKKYGCDGVMIGRGIFGTPWLFENCREGKNADERTPEERLKIMVEHAKLFEKTFCGKNGAKGHKNFAVMKKHFKAYVSGWDGAKELRVKLMETESAGRVTSIVKEYLTGK